MQYDERNLVIHPRRRAENGITTEVRADQAGWEFINFQVRTLSPDDSWSAETGSCEWAFIVLSGRVSIDSSRGRWANLGERATVFEGLPHALYLPKETSFSVRAETAGKLAAAWVPADGDHPPRHISPEDVTVEIRGGDNVTRQINDIIAPGFDCQRLVVVEVYTPSGGWSSYPPHKHDVHKTDDEGNILEADLEEIYYYLFDKPDGFAYQRIYTDPESPLHKKGTPIDALIRATSDDVVLVPEGYHPVVSGPGYTTYYLNILAGSAQSLANSDDPDHSWVKETYIAKHPNLPLYPVDG